MGGEHPISKRGAAASSRMAPAARMAKALNKNAKRNKIFAKMLISPRG
jgi:hypothetical protein